MTWKIDHQKLPKPRRKQEWGIIQNIQGLWNDFKRCNIHIAGIAKGHEKGSGEGILKIASKNFPKLTDFKPKTHEDQRRLIKYQIKYQIKPSKVKTKKTTTTKKKRSITYSNGEN